MRFAPTFLGVAGALTFAFAAQAQSTDGTIAPVPAPAQERITPPDANDADMLTTRKKKEAPISDVGLPWQRMEPNAPAAPADAPVAPTAPSAAPLGSYQPKIPFGRGESSGPAIPSGPRTTVAVPVMGVDAVESSEAAPATPVAPDADPAQEDPAEPTELTSPIFGESEMPATPRKIVLRLLNKVTAQAQLLNFKPNESVKVGHLEITAITCQTSAPRSQTDYAALLDIFDRSPTLKSPKSLFRGWMYASSPSITALEHPVYDVTMVECVTDQTSTKPVDAVEEKPAKKGKK